MDNEPEIWNGTHDDVVPKQIPAEDFMQRYFAVAKQAKKNFYPDIKLVGPANRQTNGNGIIGMDRYHIRVAMSPG